MNVNGKKMATPTIQELKELADLPGFGKAGEAIREKYDPAWGLGDANAKARTFIVFAEKTVTYSGKAEVTATSQEQAEQLARQLAEDDFDWESEFSDIEIGDVEDEGDDEQL